MNENIEKILYDFISHLNCKSDGLNEGNDLNTIKTDEENSIDGNFFNLLENKNFFRYTEYSLCSLYICQENIPIEKDVNFQTLINIITKASDVNNKFKWVDYYFKYDLKEELDILSPKSQNKELLFREYLEPHHLKNVHILRKFEEGAIFKSPEKNKVDVKIVSEYNVHNSYKNIIESFDYYLNYKLFTEAHIFHNKYGNSDHIVILVLRHYKDEKFQVPLFPDRVLIQIKSYSNDNKYSEITQKNLLQYSEIFKPYISLRKIDYNFVEEIKNKITYTL